MPPASASRPIPDLLLAISSLLLAATQAASASAAAPPDAGIFGSNSILRIRIDLRPEDLESLRREPREFVSAIVSEGDITYPKVGIHLKGSTGSFRPVDDRPALTLDFCHFQEGPKFHGLRRIQLNNSVEDPSRVSEKLAAEVFQAAGLPAPRVTRALVAFNGRSLGLYVLKEGFTEDFLACHFTNIGGDLYEPDTGHDINEHLKRNSVRAPWFGRTVLKPLADATLESDLDRRWQAFQETLDTDRFASFMVLEVMLGHRDGYCLARNNFRVYHNPEDGRIQFFPHGMDQLFGTPDFPWRPQFAGRVARSFIETPEGAKLYASRFQALLDALFKVPELTNRIDQLVRQAKPFLSGSDWTAMRDEAELLKTRVAERYVSLKAQLSAAPPKPLEFSGNAATLEGWRPADVAPGTRSEKTTSPDGRPALRLVADGETSASWRTTSVLNPGRYRFEGQCRVTAVRPLPQGHHQGAGLRIGGNNRQMADLTGDSAWQPLAAEFEVLGQRGEIEFICELRAISGEAWFDCASLRVVRLK